MLSVRWRYRNRGAHFSATRTDRRGRLGGARQIGELGTLHVSSGTTAACRRAAGTCKPMTRASSIRGRSWSDSEATGACIPKGGVGALEREGRQPLRGGPGTGAAAGRDARMVQERGVACYLAVRVLAGPSADVGRMLGLRSGVSRADQSVRSDPVLCRPGRRTRQSMTRRSFFFSPGSAGGR